MDVQEAAQNYLPYGAMLMRCSWLPINLSIQFNAYPDNPNVEYSAEDDGIIEKWIREHIDSTWHPIGTCKMAPRDKLGVVESSPSVYGIQGLKIADLSISPNNIGANTCSAAILIA